MQIGIDEVGRGSLAGPLVIGAVSLANTIEGLKDSKLLTKRVREQLAVYIYDQASFAALGWVWPDEIDELGLTKATTLAMERALKLYTEPIASIIIDGSYNYLSHRPNTLAVVKADITIPSVSAASVIAKVARDKYMREMSFNWPEYSFYDNVGYGTANHLKALNQFGPCPVHRLSFRPSFSG